jgi:hypothetical protein
MGALVHPSLVSLLLRLLPGPALRALDTWSQRAARRRWEQRQRKWRRGKEIAVAPVESIDYHLKPWRD